MIEKILKDKREQKIIEKQPISDDYKKKTFI